jgi:outer membrane receptor protein involved in Fe transport
LSGYVGVSGRYRTDTQATFGDSAYFRIPAYGLIDLRAGIQTDNGHWRAEIWGRNVTDQFYVTNVSHVVDTVARITGMPATYGFTLSYRY